MEICDGYLQKDETYMKSLPPDIEFLVNDEGAYIEIVAFIRFLRAKEGVPEEYKAEIIHLEKIADYLEENFAEIISQRELLNIDDGGLPN